MSERNNPADDIAKKLDFLRDVLRQVKSKVRELRHLGRTIDSSAGLIGEIAPVSEEWLSVAASGTTEISSLFYRGLVFLRTLLGSLNEALLKS